MGRWIDFNNDYKTLYPWFMETVWYENKTFSSVFLKVTLRQGVSDIGFAPQGASVVGVEGLSFLPQLQI